MTGNLDWTGMGLPVSLRDSNKYNEKERSGNTAMWTATTLQFVELECDDRPQE